MAQKLAVVLSKTPAFRDAHENLADP